MAKSGADLSGLMELPKGASGRDKGKQRLVVWRRGEKVGLSLVCFFGGVIAAIVGATTETRYGEYHSLKQIISIAVKRLQ